MEQENDPRRTEPSFGSDEVELGSTPTADSAVNFDELFDEIDKSVASSFAAAPSPEEERWVDELAATPDLDEEGLIPTLSAVPVPPPPTAPTPPAQPALDFGAVDDFVSPGAGRAEPKFTVASSSGEEPMSRGVLMAGGALAALGILLGAVGMVVAFGASSQIEALQQSVDTLQTKLATAQVSGDPRVGQLQAEQAGLTSRLDEMAAKVDALAVTPQTGTAPELVAALTKRLEALEHKAASAKVSEPAKAATTTVAAKPVAKPAAVSGDWTVVLVSYGTPLQADKEQTRLQKLGYQADAVKSLVDGRPWYRVRILGYKSHDAAAAAIPAIESKTGVKGAWVAHR